MKTINLMTLKTLKVSLFLVGSMAFAEASGTAKVLAESQFGLGYTKLCLSIQAVPEKLRSDFCKCMVKKYQAQKFTKQSDLDLVKKLYRGELKKPKNDVEEVLFHFDADASEECLTEASKQKKK